MPLMILRAQANVHVAAIMRRSILWLVTAAALSVSACSSDPAPVPPAELTSFNSEVRLLRIWSAKVGDAGRGVFEPLVVGDQVIAANARGVVTAFAKDSGVRGWKRELGTRLVSGVGGASGQIFVSDVEAIVHAIDPANGEEQWQAQASSEVLVPVVSGFGVAAVRSADGRVAILDPEDGTERWSESNTPPALTLNGYSRPLLLDGGVLLGLDDGRMLALNMANGDTIWETVLSVPTGRSEVERLVDIDAEFAIDDEGIYVANYQGKAARLEPARGQIVWSTPVSAGSGIALDDSGLIVVDEDDNVIKLDKESGEQLWLNDTMLRRSLSPPAFTPEGDILLGDVEGYLHVLDTNTGAEIGRSRPSSSAIKSRPVLVEDTVYIQASDGIVAAFRVTR